MRQIQLIDLYEGKNVELGKLSQAFRITYRKTRDTVTDKEINPIHEKIRVALAKSYTVELRS